MLTKDDLVLLLTEMQAHGAASSAKYIKEVYSSEAIPLNVIQFINKNRQLDIAAFYEMLRKNNNSNRSPLYRNLVKDEFKEAEDALTILSVLNLQIVLFAKKLEDDRMFLKHSRAQEITDALNAYYRTYDLRPCYKLIKLIKADLKAFESIR